VVTEMTNRETGDAPVMHQQCTGTTKTGAPCRARALPGADTCVTHDPGRIADLAEWRRRGGKAKSNKARARKALPAEILTAAEIQGVLAKALRQVLSGDLEPGRANAAATIARALLAAKQVSDLEDRLTALESAAGLTEGQRT
jgi:hypothetical protein